MDDGILPPFAERPGPPVDDAAVLGAFARNEAAGHSPRFHVEDSVLIAAPGLATAMRIGPATILVRLDVPPDMAGAKRAVEEALGAEGMALLDEETLLATPVAVQRLGLRASSWDLWGRDLDEAFAALRAAAVGEPLLPDVPPFAPDE